MHQYTSICYRGRPTASRKLDFGRFNWRRTKRSARFLDLGKAYRTSRRRHCRSTFLFLFSGLSSVLCDFNVFDLCFIITFLRHLLSLGLCAWPFTVFLGPPSMALPISNILRLLLFFSSLLAHRLAPLYFDDYQSDGVHPAGGGALVRSACQHMHGFLQGSSGHEDCANIIEGKDTWIGERLDMGHTLVHALRRRTWA
ncbi:hypothetical protein B0J12DRAFT_62219 [Macrophomina phaseolina]|uniref:Uncharacterized protein n=1 Tax=Macrophomina phaseolina TaxID=35725 RepID=A0ABQ8GCI9_9PEZI|nr:hypothetical protein B0J12DRAFT_62219 [Macrophomina phaseolina]